MLLKPDNTRPRESEESVIKLNMTMFLGKKKSFKAQLAMILIRNLEVLSRLPWDSENESLELVHSYYGFFATGY